jgi:predicted Ser/Thr protein kinase/tetratricopeptide (TPR) repeat protein
MEPKQLGRYVVESLLGRGAMGTVYLARDPVIGRLVALKTLSVPTENEESDEFRQRFLREAQAAGILNHPSLVMVYDAGVDDSTMLSFIAMEYIEGKTLKDLLKTGQGFPFSEVARIGAALASGLDYAHSKGVVHRDIKPANIIMTPQGTVKITDFGVARMESSNLTATGQFIGTPNYMSPEQVAGTTIDGRSDLFSLGVVLFELLTGSRPFAGQTLTEVSYKIVHEPAPIPSQARPSLPPAFNPIVLKLLEKDPARRYAKGADVARALDALRRVLGGGDAGAAAEPAPDVDASAVGTILAGAVSTATKATELEAAPTMSMTAAARKAQQSPLRRPIELLWTAIMLAAVIVPIAAVLIVLFLKIDRGPYEGAAPGEAERRHHVVLGQRQAAAAITAGRPKDALAALADVWDQAPQSNIARQLKLQAEQAQELQQSTAQREQQANTLREEGRAFFRDGLWREAQSRFEQVLEFNPNDSVAKDYLELARDKQKAPKQQRLGFSPAPASPAASSAVAQAVAVPAGDGSLEVYFNSPISSGTIELDLDNATFARKPFDFRKKVIFGIKRKATGVFQDTITIPGGNHDLVARLRDAEGKLLGEQRFTASVSRGKRLSLRVQMEGETAAPRFSLMDSLAH